ncbi:MAG: hypothetical protein NZ534_08815, partial [Bacteroidia bacterium]|nr:hypothetical protein [Bacteroidia bacterium]
LTMAGCATVACVPYAVLDAYGYEVNLNPERLAGHVLAALGGVVVGLLAAVIYHFAAAATKGISTLAVLGTVAGVAAGTVAVVKNVPSNDVSALSPSQTASPPSDSLALAEDTMQSKNTPSPISSRDSASKNSYPAPPKPKPENYEPTTAVKNPPSSSTDNPSESVAPQEIRETSLEPAPNDAAKSTENTPKTRNDELVGIYHVGLGDLGYPIFIYFNRPEVVEIVEKNFVTYDSKPDFDEMRYGDREKVFVLGDQKHMHVDLSFIKARLDQDPEVAYYTTVAFDKWVVVKAVRQGAFESSSGYADVAGSSPGRLQGYVLEYLIFRKNVATGDGTHLLKIYAPRVYKKLASVRKQMDFRVVPK